MTIRRVLSIIACSVLLASSSYSQLDSGWFGDWKGMMHIYKLSRVIDSVSVTMTIRPSGKIGSYVWRTEYHSKERPMVKDYTLRTVDASKGQYITDEGEGVELRSYLIGSKMYSVFEVQNTMLTATYELLDNQLTFEVTAGKKDTTSGGGVTNYSVNTLQQVVLRRMESTK